MDWRGDSPLGRRAHSGQGLSVALLHFFSRAPDGRQPSTCHLTVHKRSRADLSRDRWIQSPEC